MNAKVQRLSYGVWLSNILLIMSCSGPLWPSQGMTVDISNSRVSATDVVKATEKVLQANGFKDIGRDGRDEIKHQDNVFYFVGPMGIQVVVTADLKDVVLIRVNQNRKSFTPEASYVFDELAAKLEVIWPGKVIKESAPTK